MIPAEGGAAAACKQQIDCEIVSGRYQAGRNGFYHKVLVIRERAAARP
jgi:hypothetical protein